MSSSNQYIATLMLSVYTELLFCLAAVVEIVLAGGGIATKVAVAIFLQDCQHRFDASNKCFSVRNA